MFDSGAEYTCAVVKGERNIAYGDDCYCHYTKVNYEEPIVRCRDCVYSRDSGSECGYRKPYYFMVSPDCFCAWGVSE